MKDSNCGMVLYVSKMGSLLLHCPMARELWSFVFVCLGCSQFCQKGWRICWYVGKGGMLGTVSETFGMLSLFASCGLSGRNEIIRYSKAWNNLWWM